MTREELKNKFIGDYLNENYHQDSYEASAEKEDIARACLSAIEWADKHPKKGLVDFDKACEWLDKNFNMPNDFQKHFRKAMEGQE